MRNLSGVHVHITGVVQGVGFRPFVFNLANVYEITGWVRNSSAGVDIHAEGLPENLEVFLKKLEIEYPPLAIIHSFEVKADKLTGASTFEIHKSQPIPGAYQPVSPDVCVCEDCLREFTTPDDRRFLYPFINCTNCGPRFTIIKDIPYDRPETTMSSFPMCSDCQAEYEDPRDRRFHAQPIACPACGPHIWLQSDNLQIALDEENPVNVIRNAQVLLQEGKILAVKGLGGFHLACDATNEEAVAELRKRKRRIDKPYAVMFPDIETIDK